MLRRRGHVANNLRLKVAQAEHDMTQGDLAEAVGATRQTIGLIEAGKYREKTEQEIGLLMLGGGEDDVWK